MHLSCRRGAASIPVAELASGTIERHGTTMTMKDWEKKVLAESGAAGRVAEVDDELRLALVAAGSSPTAEWDRRRAGVNAFREAVADADLGDE